RPRRPPNASSNSNGSATRTGSRTPKSCSSSSRTRNSHYSVGDRTEGHGCHAFADHLPADGCNRFHRESMRPLAGSACFRGGRREPLTREGIRESMAPGVHPPVAPGSSLRTKWSLFMASRHRLFALVAWLGFAAVAGACSLCSNPINRATFGEEADL